ncbi:RNA polymerase sigma-24 subunit ECF subfamily (plasmid) [Asticcacaulis sp. DW145]|uniref:RNA polymerase sigma factor n=1 Tax=Asticcacaulis sp. DW145 TaxID=3095608 RepID=UPI00308D056A|nr:RNA polymerase sigma-24 subunit ECF subfamily [Asticcacaulis sp. DW145]
MREDKRLIERVFQASSGRLTAYLAARFGDVALAEDALSAAFAAALRLWPDTGVPTSPEAWLYQVARRAILDTLRRRKTAAAYAADPVAQRPEAEDAPGFVFPDERLKLLFVCAHPAIAADLHIALMLNTVLGVEAHRIAHAFVISPATMSQRLTRAKAKIREARIPFVIPDAEDMPPRLHSVLQAIYAGFGIGWDEARTRMGAEDLTQECLLLARLVAELMPQAPEALGCLALLLYSDARHKSRTRDGAYVPLSEQDATLWDADQMREAGQVLQRAARFQHSGPFQLMAAIQSAHIEARLTGRDYSEGVAHLYAGLRHIAPGLGVEVAFAMALGNAQGPEFGLRQLDLIDPVQTASYQPYWATRADLLRRTGRMTEAASAYDLAIGLSGDSAVRQYLIGRRAGLGAGGAHA